MKTKLPKMTEEQKIASKLPSRFIRVIPSNKWKDYQDVPNHLKYKFDSQGRRIL